MSFQVPLSSSPVAPTTPGSEKKKNRNVGAFGSFGSSISTTPTGLPPSSVGSFTPAGPPPSSVFGSSQPGSSGKTLFKGKPKHTPVPTSNLDSSKLARFLDQSDNFNLRGANDSMIKGTFALPDSSPLSRHHEDADADGDEDEEQEDEEEAYEGDEVDDYLEDGDQSYGVALDRRITGVRQPTGEQSPSFVSSKANGMPGPSPNKAPNIPGPTSKTIGPRKQSKSSQGARLKASISDIESEARGLMPNKTLAPTIAQDLSERLHSAPLDEPDDLILGTEELVGALHTAIRNDDADTGSRASILSNTCDRLCNLWKSCCDRDARNTSWADEVFIGIGPDEHAPSANSATFLSTLLLSLHHPPAATGGQALAISHLGRPNQSSILSYQSNLPLILTAYPKVLFNWLDNDNDPYQAILSEVRNHKPNATAHEFFWDIVFKLVFRGRFAELLAMLKEADFRFARTAIEDGLRQTGYGRVQVDNINMVVGSAIQTLQTCPALTDDDWHVHREPWTIFRKHIKKASENLINFAEGRDKDLDHEEPSFEASNFGLKSTDRDFSRSSRRAESRVPWTIFQNLKTLYGMLRGGSLEILSYSENWVEGSIALTALWSGRDDDMIASGSQASGKQSSRASRSEASRLVDADIGSAYRKRLAEAFARVIEGGADGSEDPPMLPDTSKPLEVALSAIFERDINGAVGILRSMSLPISDAVAEIGTVGGWLQASTLDTAMDVLDDEDRDILSLGDNAIFTHGPKISRISIMKDYAEALLNKAELTGKRESVMKGWELSIAVLARVEVGSGPSSRTEIRNILNRLPLDSDAQIDRIIHICDEHDIPDEGRKLVEQYAGKILDNSDDYGTALIYYARAHSYKKIKGVLDLLISYSLVQSTTYPARISLDPNLHSLIYAPKESLEHLALLDNEGAAILHKALSGYATLRKFYDLRDSAVELAEGQSPSQSPVAVKKESAAAILALINSAADSIHGGLYDSHNDSIIRVDGLLTLLGEAIVFINRAQILFPLLSTPASPLSKVSLTSSAPIETPPLLTHAQAISFLSAIEDLSTAPPAIIRGCDDFLHSSLVAFGHRPPLASPRRMLKRQMSSITTSGSSFSLVGSSLLDSQLVDAMDVDSNPNNNSADSSRALTKSNDDVKRGWDWRKGLNEGATGEDVIKILRLGLAKEVAAHWMMEGSAS